MIYSLHVRYFFFLFSLLVLDAQSALFPKSDTLTSVHADLQVLVKEKKIRAKIEYTYIAPESQTSIRFYLTSDVTINYLKGDNIHTYEFDLKASPLPTVTIFLKKTVAKGDAMRFSLSYEGQPEKIFQTESYHWIDLDSDYILFPVFTNFQLFHYTLKASLDDHDYTFIDTQQKRLHNTITISPREADYGFTSLFACKKIQFSSFVEHRNKLTIISGQADTVKQTWSKTALRILTYYNTTFGKATPQHEVTILFKPLPLSVNPVQKTNGNIIVLASDSNEETLTHELAHLWWSRGNHSTMEKWLTESFAVYSQLMYWRSLGHQQEFDQEIARLKVRSEKLPALLTADRFGYDGNSLIYSKGPYLLSVLEQRLGKEKFIQLLSNLNQHHTSTTEDFLSELEKIESRRLRDDFENMLSN